jgi:hypothetical protein
MTDIDPTIKQLKKYGFAGITPPIMGALFDSGYFTPEYCKAGDHPDADYDDEGNYRCLWCGTVIAPPLTPAEKTLIGMDASELRLKALEVWTLRDDEIERVLDSGQESYTTNQAEDIEEMAKSARIIEGVALRKSHAVDGDCPHWADDPKYYKMNGVY